MLTLTLAGFWPGSKLRDCALNPIPLARALYFACLVVTPAH